MRPVRNELPSVDPGAVRLALVAEAPGADEESQGRPFVGKSGWILNQYLASAGINRSQCFVGNVCQCRPSPASNEFHLLEWNGAQVQEGIAALRADLAAFRPHIVVCLGNAALHLFRHGNTAPPKSKKLGLFQWPSRVGTWRGSLFHASANFDPFEAADLRVAGPRGVLRTPSLSNREVGERQSQQLAVVGKLQRISPDAGGSTPPLATTFASIHNTDSPHAGALPSTSPAESRGSENAPPGARAGESTPPSHLAGSPDARASIHGAAGSPFDFAAVHASPGDPASANAGRPPFYLRQVASETNSGDSFATFKTLSTYHPAATFREPSFTFPLVSDLKRAVAEARSPELVLPRRSIVWGLSADEIEARCAAIRACKAPVGFDIEGGLGGLQCCSFATTPNDAFVIDLMGEYLDKPRLMVAIASVLEDERVPKVAWNAAYERAILEATSSITMRNYEDGMLAWWERWSELPKGLDFVASILTREPYWAEGIGWDAKTGAPRVTGAPFFTYNGIDSCVTLEIWQHPIIRAVVESRTPVAFAV